MADGHLTDKQLIFSQTEKEHNHMVKLSEIFKGNLSKTEPKFYTTKNEITNYMCKSKYILVITDVKYAKLLKEKLNLTNQSKTYFPPNLDYLNTKEKFLAFFTGFVDGDGCIHKKESSKNSYHILNISCHASWVKNFQFFSDKLKEYFDIKSNVYINSRGYSVFDIGKNASVAKIKNEMLKLEIPYMERKWNEVKDIITPFEYSEFLKENEEIIKKEILNNKNLNEIALILNIPFEKVRNYCGRNKISKFSLKKDYETLKENREFIKNNRIKGLTLKEIAKLLDVELSILSNFCQNGLRKCDIL